MQIHPITKFRRIVTGSRRPLTCGLLGGLAVTLLAVSGGAAQRLCLAVAGRGHHHLR